MFIGRSEEVDILNNAYAKSGFQFPVIYGRRRVGKTTLINEFCKGKKSIYFVAVESTLKENLEILSHQIFVALAPGAPRTPFASFRDAMDYVFERARDERIVFAIDEYPYLAESDRAVSSVLQAAIDKYQQNSQLFLILCGSSMSFMENQVLGYKSPLYGRRTTQLKLQALDYLSSSEMLKGFSVEDRVMLYSITGGIPEYLSRVDGDASVRENVRRMLFDPSGRLFEEPDNLLKQELKSPQTYRAIIAAVAGGASKLNEIATQVGIATSQASNMLGTLIALGLVRKEVPVTEKDGSKKTLYALDDLMFAFWYRFVLPDLSRISAGLGAEVCEEVFSDSIHSHIGLAFERCAIQYMWHQRREGKLTIPFQRIGRWWGNNPTEQREEEIDFIAMVKYSAIFGECKWRNQPLGQDVLENLVRRAALFPAFSQKHYALFSKSGFTKGVKERASELGNIQLIGVADMFP